MKGKNLIALFGLPGSGIDNVALEIISGKYSFHGEITQASNELENVIYQNPRNIKEYRDLTQNFEVSRLVQVDSPYHLRESRLGSIDNKDLSYCKNHDLPSLVALKDYTIDNSRHESYLEHQIDELLIGMDPLRLKLISSKRQNHISWEEYFFAITTLSSKRSKDPSTQVGACIVGADKKIISIGYNGFPKGCSDDKLPWGKNDKNILNNKNLYVAHAEENAIANASGKSLKGSTLYVNLHPCNKCAIQIIQHEIAQVYYLSEKNKNKDSTKAAKRLFELSGVKAEKIDLKRKHIHLNIYSI